MIWKGLRSFTLLTIAWLCFAHDESALDGPFPVGEGLLPIPICIGRSNSIFLTWDQSLLFCQEHEGTLMQLPVFSANLTLLTIAGVKDGVTTALNDAGIPAWLIGLNFFLDYRDKSPGWFGDPSALGGKKKEWQTSNNLPFSTLKTKEHKHIWGALQPGVPICTGRSNSIFLTWDQPVARGNASAATRLQREPDVTDGSWRQRWRNGGAEFHSFYFSSPKISRMTHCGAIRIYNNIDCMNDAGIPAWLIGLNFFLDYRDKSPGLFADPYALGGAKKEWQTSNNLPFSTLKTKEHKHIWGALQPSEGLYAERCLTLSSYFNEWKVHDIPCAWGSVGVAVCLFNPLKCGIPIPPLPIPDIDIPFNPFGK